MLCLCAVLGAAAKMEAQLVILSPLEDHLMVPRTSRPLPPVRPLVLYAPVQICQLRRVRVTLSSCLVKQLQLTAGHSSYPCYVHCPRRSRWLGTSTWPLCLDLPPPHVPVQL